MNMVRPMRPMPPDFPELARTMNQRELRQRYSCGTTIIRRWSRECGIDWSERYAPRPAPDEFTEIAPLHSVREMEKLYHCGGETIRRWLKETGVTQKNARGHYVKHNEADEIALCLTCPFPKCKSNCGRVPGC